MLLYAPAKRGDDARPLHGIYNRLYAIATTKFVPFVDGEPYPQLQPAGKPFVVKNLFTDLKRHDLGPAFHERNHDDTLELAFVTEPLWGVATTAPYGHDGRSINLEEVILRHGGEAQESRDAFAALDERAQHSVIVYLATLVLFPQDRLTASGRFRVQDLGGSRWVA